MSVVSLLKNISDKTVNLIKQLVSYTRNAPGMEADIKTAAVKAQESYDRYKKGFIKLTGIVQADENITPQKAKGWMKPLKSHI